MLCWTPDGEDLVRVDRIESAAGYRVQATYVPPRGRLFAAHAEAFIDVWYADEDRPTEASAAPGLASLVQEILRQVREGVRHAG